MKSKRQNAESIAVQKPEVVPEIRPCELVQTAQLLSAEHSTQSLIDQFPEARKLLIKAATYLHACNAKPVTNFAQLTGVPFKEILESNNKNNPDDQKHLPGITTKEGLVKLIRKYYSATAIHFTQQQQKEMYAKTSQKLKVIEDEAGESFINGEFIPPVVLTKIRQWRLAQRQKRAGKGK